MAKWNVERGTSLGRVPLLITFVILIHRGSLDQNLGVSVPLPPPPDRAKSDDETNPMKTRNENIYFENQSSHITHWIDASSACCFCMPCMGKETLLRDFLRWGGRYSTGGGI